MNVLIAGDYCPKERITNLIENEYYDQIFGEIKSIIEKTDYSIVNFECPVRTTDGEGIKKAGPSLKCSKKAIDALKFAGFRCVTLANNHFYDQGEDGVNETIHYLDKVGIDYVGGGHNLKEASRTFYYTYKGKTLAIINCCEKEFSIATNLTGGSNPLDPVKQYYAIQEARQNADYILIIVHGGIEHYQYPSSRMVDTYRFFIDAGADAVVNHHQHCFSGAEVYKDKPIFYGLGNFCFDWTKRSSMLWEEGFMVVLTFDNGSVKYKLYPYNQNGISPGIHLKDDKSYIDWEKRFKKISSILSDPAKLNKKYEELLARTERIYSSNLTPYTNKIALALYMRHLLPMLMPKRKLRTLLNMMMCESHYDRMLQMLKNYSK